jgi:hypothetical protein
MYRAKRRSERVHQDQHKNWDRKHKRICQLEQARGFQQDQLVEVTGEASPGTGQCTGMKKSAEVVSGFYTRRPAPLAKVGNATQWEAGTRGELRSRETHRMRAGERQLPARPAARRVSAAQSPHTTTKSVGPLGDLDDSWDVDDL